MDVSILLTNTLIFVNKERVLFSWNSLENLILCFLVFKIPETFKHERPKKNCKSIVFVTSVVQGFKLRDTDFLVDR